MATPATTNRIHSMQDLAQARQQALERQLSQTVCVISVGTATCGLAAGAAETLETLRQEVQQIGLPEIVIVETGCLGLCALEPVVEVRLPGRPPVLYGPVDPQAARRIIQEHIRQGKLVGDLVISNTAALPA